MRDGIQESVSSFAANLWAATPEAVGQTGVVVVLVGMIATLFRLLIKRTEDREKQSRAECDERIAREVVHHEAEIRRLRMLLGVVSRTVTGTHPELAAYLRHDSIEPGAADPLIEGTTST